MEHLQDERREMARVLQAPGPGPDPSLGIARRTFLHRSLLTAGVTVGAATYGWFPLLNTIHLAWGQTEFKFAWISDTHLQPKAATHPHEFPKLQEQMNEFATLRDMINWCIAKPNEGIEIGQDPDAMKALDPVSSKGEFRFTAANGHAYLAFQARLDDGRSTVRAGAECSRGRRWSGTGQIQVASGRGGCAGVAPPAGGRDTEIRPPVIRLPHLLRGRRLEPGQIIDVQVKLKHPVWTGLDLRGGEWVRVTEPLYLTEMDVLYDGRRVSRVVMTPALADDPLITFRLRPQDEGLLRVVFRNSRGAEFAATQHIRFR